MIVCVCVCVCSVLLISAAFVEEMVIHNLPKQCLTPKIWMIKVSGSQEETRSFLAVHVAEQGILALVWATCSVSVSLCHLLPPEPRSALYC